MFKIKTLSVKNFMSVGNATQAVSFDRQDLTLVLGQNLDLGGDDTGARNGTGKTTIINALSYALYGSALTNIKKDNLINKTNGKNMLVTIEFEKDGIDFKIERGRKPNTMAFYVGGQEQEITDESQGDSRETQAEIERMLGMSHDMFKHIVALNTYTEPFLALKANDQRAIIEQLLGITMLSDKADTLKEQLKATRDAITAEEYRIKAVTDANARIQEQIEATRRRQTMWRTKNLNDINELRNALEVVGDIDIDAELAAHNALDIFNEKVKNVTEINRWKLACESEQVKLLKQLDKLKSEIEKVEKHECYACGQLVHDSKHEEILEAKHQTLKETSLQYLANDTQLAEHLEALKLLSDLGPQPQVFYDKKEDAINHKNTVANLKQQLESKTNDIDPYAEQIQEMETQAVEEINYDTINELANVKDHQQTRIALYVNVLLIKI